MHTNDRHIRFGTMPPQQLEELMTRPYIAASSRLRSYIEQVHNYTPYIYYVKYTYYMYSITHTHTHTHTHTPAQGMAVQKSGVRGQVRPLLGKCPGCLYMCSIILSLCLSLSLCIGWWWGGGGMPGSVGVGGECAYKCESAHTYV